MNILTIIPIAKGIPRDELAYFSAQEVTIGTLVTIPFGNRSIKGVVVDSQPVRDLKGSIKQQQYALRNVTTIHRDSSLPFGIFAAAQKTAHYYVQPIGSLLRTMLPTSLFDYYCSHPHHAEKVKKTTPSNIQSLQVPFHERISWYKTTVRENLARHASTCIIVPTVIMAEKIAAHLNTGIADRMVVLHSKKTKKYLESNLPRLVTDKNPVVVIATAPFITIDRDDWDTLIIESSSSSHYRYTFGGLSFDMRYFIEQIARHQGNRLVFADTLLDVSIVDRITKRTITSVRTTWHIERPEDFQLLDMKNIIPAIPGVKKIFSPLHETTIEKIHVALKQKFSVLLITGRKGFAPITVCSDCSTAVTCPTCSTPLVLHRTKKDASDAHAPRIYMCHHCMTVTKPIDRCSTCSSWKLTGLGISTDSLYDAVTQEFPETTVTVCDGDTTTQSSLQKTIDHWQSEGGIIIATPMILPYIDSVDMGCIISMDSLLSLPIYTGSEQGLFQALAFLERVKHTAIIQTRSFDHDVISAIARENIFEFMNNELEMRKQFHYPPESVLVSVTFSIKPDQARSTTDMLEKMFQAYNPDILAKRSHIAGRIALCAIMKVSPESWAAPDSSLHAILTEISHDAIIEINPDSIL